MKRMNAAVLRTIALCASAAAAGQAVADVTELPQDIQDKLYNPSFCHFGMISFCSRSITPARQVLPA